jgi:sterol desaturase/sphingolipid hydroxylase (fatty acid hydroxylase superfamily)
MEAMEREQPIRLFKSDFLEFFSHISPLTVAILWTPVVIFFLILSIRTLPSGNVGWIIPVGFILGWFGWTFMEYALHRFLFHYHPRTEKFKRLFFIVHGIHHAQPMCKTRLVMPPALSVPMAFVFYGLFSVLMVNVLGAKIWFYPIFAGIIGGYLVYDLTHYQIHHSKIKKGLFFKIRTHHLRHHGKCDFLRFGVTFPFWDYIFGTMPKEDCSKIIARRIQEGNKNQ